jgi:hypothetical protein
MLYVFERDMAITVIGTVVDPSEDLVSRFVEGSAIAPGEVDAPIRVDIETAPDAYPDYFELQGVPIASARLIKALAAAGADNVVAYPAVVDEYGKQIPGYSIMHVVGRVASMDLKKSECTQYRNKVARIKKLALVKKLPTELKMFRMDEKQAVILAAEDVAKAVKGLPGVVVSPAEGWSDKHRY